MLFYRVRGVTQSLDEAFMRINFAEMLSGDFGSLDPDVKDAIRVALDKIKNDLGEQRVEMLDNSKKKLQRIYWIDLFSLSECYNS